MEPRWRRAVNFTTAALGEEVGKIYVAQYFPPETKAAALDVVHNIMAAMGRRIDQLSWMSAEAKAKAHEKLAAFTPKIGYPDKRSEEHTSELQSLMRLSYAVFCLKKKKNNTTTHKHKHKTQ